MFEGEERFSWERQRPNRPSHHPRPVLAGSRPVPPFSSEDLHGLCVRLADLESARRRRFSQPARLCSPRDGRAGEQQEKSENGKRVPARLSILTARQCLSVVTAARQVFLGIMLHL